MELLGLTITWKTVLGAIIFYGALAILSIVPVIFFRRASALRKYGIASTGKVIGITKKSSRSSTPYSAHPIIQFSHKGNTYEVESLNGSYPSRYKKGDTVNIRINTKDPSKTDLDGFAHIWFPVFASGFIVVILFILVTYVFLKNVIA